VRRSSQRRARFQRAWFFGRALVFFVFAFVAAAEGSWLGAVLLGVIGLLHVGWYLWLGRRRRSWSPTSSTQPGVSVVNREDC